MKFTKVIWWNVQRLLSPEDSVISRNLDATEATGWNKKSYQAKLDAIAAVLHHLTGGETPGILALAEVENKAVVRDLITTLGWSELIAPEGFERHITGYDVVLLYSSKIFDLVTSPITHTLHNRYSTRDIFEVHLRISTGEELLVLCNHWPSRLYPNSEPLRISLADYCMRIVDHATMFKKEDLIDSKGKASFPKRKLLENRWNQRVLVIGDFNDSPFNTCISQIMNTTRDLHRVLKKPKFPKTRGIKAVHSYFKLRPRLYNPTWRLLTPETKEPGGTLYWNSEWHMLDQMFFSAGLLQESNFQYVKDSFKIHAPKKVPGPNGKQINVLTRNGYPKKFDSKKLSGVSDHLPIYCELKIPE